MRKINKKDSETLLGLFIMVIIGAVFIYLLPFLLIGALIFIIAGAICEDKDKKDDNNSKDNHS